MMYLSIQAMETITHKPIKDPLPSCIRTLMTVIFNKLGSEKFLDGCRNLRSSTPNESLNHILRRMAPKELFSSPQETKLAVNQSTFTFNSDFTWTVKNFFHQRDMQLSKNSERFFNCIDKLRIYQLGYKTIQESKTKRWKKKYGIQRTN